MFLRTMVHYYQTTHEEDRILQIEKKYFSSRTGAILCVQTDRKQTDKTRLKR
jgi:hypothetical protein